MAQGDVVSSVNNYNSNETSGYYCNFNGTSNINIGNNVAVTTNQSWKFRVYFPSGQNTSGIIAKGTAGLNAEYNFVIGSTREIRIYCGSSLQQTATGVITADQWDEVIITKDSNTWDIYVNGSYVTTLTISTSAGTDSLYFGSINSGDYLTGRLDDIKVWNKTLTSAEVSTEYSGTAVTDGLIHKWDFDDNDYTDSVGGADGTNNGTTLIAFGGNTFDNQLATQRTTENDIWLLSGTRGAQLVSVTIEEA